MKTTFIKVTGIRPMAPVQNSVCSKISVSQWHKSVPRKVEFRVQTERFFGNARQKKTKFLRDSCLVCQDSLGNAFSGKHFLDTANLHGTPVETFNRVGLQCSIS